MTTIPGIERLLTAWLPTQPWFVEKTWTIEAVELLADTWIDRQEGLAHVVVGVSQLDPLLRRSTTSVYQVLLVARSELRERLGHALIGTLEGPEGPMHVYDALHDRDVTGVLLEQMRQHGDLGQVRFVALSEAEIPAGERSLVIPGPHRHTVLAFGNDAALKVYRTLAPGVNPDVEIHRALTIAGCEHVVPMLGSIDGSWTDPSSATMVEGNLAILQTHLVTATDGWRMAETSVHDLFAEADLRADEVGGDFAGEARRLGQATATVHADLRAGLGTDVWGPEHIGELLEGMRRRLAAGVAEVPELGEHEKALRLAYDGAEQSVTTVDVQRIHGDLHLGQVIRTSVNWKLLDFEGRPDRPMAERALLDSPLADVAAMLRSLDYVASRVLFADHPEDAQLSYRAREWAGRNQAAFCLGYGEVAGTDPREHDSLLLAYECDRAVVELVHGARARPAWGPITLAGVERLAQAITTREG